MKKLIFSLLTLLSFSFTQAQTAAPEPRSIAVIGTAEMEIVPDEIYVSATLREFTKEKKKYAIEDLEKGMVNFIESITKVPRTDISMDNLDADVIALRRKSKKDAVISKSYEIKFKDQKQIAQFFAAMDSLNVSYANVVRYSHSKMAEFKKQIKIDAIKAAKDKSDYLLLAIGSRTGKPLKISEPNGFVSVDDGDFRPFRGNVYQSNTVYSGGESEERSEENSIGGKKIKLRYQINAEFEIL